MVMVGRGGMKGEKSRLFSNYMQKKRKTGT